MNIEKKNFKAIKMVLIPSIRIREIIFWHIIGFQYDKIQLLAKTDFRKFTIGTPLSNFSVKRRGAIEHFFLVRIIKENIFY